MSLLPGQCTTAAVQHKHPGISCHTVVSASWRDLTSARGVQLVPGCSCVQARRWRLDCALTGDSNDQIVCSMLSMQISRSCPHKNSMLVMVAPLLLQLHITKVKCCACPKCDWHASQASCQVSHAGANMTNPSQAAARSSHLDAMHCITSQ